MLRFACVALLSALLLSSVFGSDNSTKYEYGLMIDAGSTGSRIHIYTWPKRSSPSLPLVQSAPIGEEPWSERVKPGISAFAGDPSKAGESLLPLIEYAKNRVPQKLWPYTPIYLKATAGMRLLPFSEQTPIIESCRQVLQSSPFGFVDDWARVITGIEEGVYGWVTVNYLLGYLEKSDPMQTVGALDLGGASTQVTFVPSSPPPRFRGVNLTLAGEVYPLYSHSYLGYGNDQARYLKNQSVVANGGYQKSTSDGCLPAGMTTSFEWDNEVYNLTGASSFDDCVEETLKIFDKDASCPLEPCSFNGVFQPTPRGNFVAFSAYYYAVDFYNLSSFTSIKDMAAAGEAFCALDYEEIIQEYFGTDSWDFIDTYCFLNAYICSLLKYGLGMSEENRIIFLETIRGVDLGWTLGAMIFEADLLPWEIDIPTVTPPSPPPPSPLSPSSPASVWP